MELRQWGDGREEGDCGGTFGVEEGMGPRIREDNGGRDEGGVPPAVFTGAGSAREKRVGWRGMGDRGGRLYGEREEWRGPATRFLGSLRCARNDMWGKG